ncbi:MAG TPA: hypothetical protein VMD49_00065 [Steroidobacteraceae bacterium]|nr:hypothetical protein [Steroidobacteraceae bacterium]
MMDAVARPSRSLTAPGRVLALGWIMIGVLGACSLRGSATAHPGTAAPAAAQAAAAAGVDMVAAVSSGKTSLPVDVRFALRQRPELGQAAELDLLVTPSAQLDKLITSFHAQDGVAIREGAEPSVQDRPEPGVAIPHRLTIVAQQDGIFYVDATVLADWGGESIGHTFTIPVIAGAGAQ